MPAHDPARSSPGDPRVLSPAVVRERLCALTGLVGSTPLVEIETRFRGATYRICAKLEYRGMTGSIKDRMALHILREAYRTGRIEPGDTIAEATSGNTGISFAALGSALGHPVRIFMPDWMSAERVRLIESHGAQVIPVSAEEGGFLGSIRLADALAEQEDRVFLPHQFDNSVNALAHEETTAPEILTQLRRLHIAPQAFVAGVGTGGTVMGVGRYLRAAVPAITIHPLEPANSPTLRTGKKVGSHRIQGISDEFVPSIVHLDELDEIIDVDDGDAIILAQRLSRELGLGVGISSGANFIGALKLAERYGAGSTVATIFCDSSKKYLSTDLCRDEPVREDHLAPHVEFGGMRSVLAVR